MSEEWNSRVKSEMEHPYTLTHYTKDGTFYLTRKIFKGYGDEVDDIEKHANYHYGSVVLFDGRTEQHKKWAAGKRRVRIPAQNKSVTFGLEELNHTPQGDQEAIWSIVQIIFEWTDQII